MSTPGRNVCYKILAADLLMLLMLLMLKCCGIQFNKMEHIVQKGVSISVEVTQKRHLKLHRTQGKERTI